MPSLPAIPLSPNHDQADFVNTLLSLGQATVYRVNHTKLDRHRFAATFFMLVIAISLPVMGFGYLLLPLLLGTERVAAQPLALAYLLTFIPLNFIALALLALDQAEKRFTRYNLLRLIMSASYFAALLLLLAVNAMSVVTALWACCLGVAMMVAIGLLLWRNDLEFRPDIHEAMSLLSQGVLFHGTTLITVLAGQIDRVVVMRYFPDEEIGHYVVALTIATAGFGLVTHSVHTVLFPHLAAEVDRHRALSKLGEGLRRSTLFLLLSSAAAMTIVPYILPFLFGEAYSPAVPIAMLLVLAFVPLGLRQIAVHCLRAFRDAQTGILVEGAALVAFGILILPALAHLQLLGVALALLVANGFALCFLATLMRRRYDIQPADWLLPGAGMVSDLHLLIFQVRKLHLTSILKLLSCRFFV